MHNIIFDMETGDPDDIITLLLLLNNPQVNLKGVSCYEGSPLQIGLIQHVIELSGLVVPVAGWNTEEKELNPYYHNIFGTWKSIKADINPIELLNEQLTENVKLLTGAPLTNIALFLRKYPNKIIEKMVVQGGYLGNVIPFEKRLDKFKKRDAIRTYNLSNDIEAFNIINYSEQICDLTYVTKDLCHGFLYHSDIHKNINFSNNKTGQLLKKALGHYANKNTLKAMHDPLAMLYLLYPDIGIRKSISMSFKIEKEFPIFSSIEQENNFTYGLVEYNQDNAWSYFKNLCEHKHSVSLQFKP